MPYGSCSCGVLQRMAALSSLNMTDTPLPTVTVIIPTYNRGHVIRRALHSVLHQTYQSLEVIVVDDGSTDNTEAIVESFNDPRILYIRHETKLGAAAARNTGIKAASADFIAFQDSDDEWLPEKLGKQMKVFEDTAPEVGVVYTDMWRIKGEKRQYKHSPIIRPEDGTVYEQALDRVMGIGIGTAVIRRECFHKAGVFDEEFPRFIDLEIFIRLSKYYYFYHINLPLVNYYDMGEGISKNDEALITAYELIFKKHSFGILKNKKLLAKHLGIIGDALCKGGKLNQGRNYLLKAVKLYPLNIKCLMAVFVSLFGKEVYSKAIKLRRLISPEDL